MLSTLLEDKVRGGKWHWPNAYFTKVGLWSLREAHNRFGQSLAGNYYLESRVRENRTHGSEGGESGSTGLPYPYVRL